MFYTPLLCVGVFSFNAIYLLLCFSFKNFIQNNMKEYQKEYEEYMKSITDGFAKLCSFEGAESILAGEGNRVSVMIYQYQEFLLEYDKDLKYMYRLESFDERVKEFHKKRQEVAEKFLNENTLTYDEWIAKHKTNS